MKTFGSCVAVLSVLLLIGCSDSLLGPAETASRGAAEGSGEAAAAGNHTAGSSRGVLNFAAPLDPGQEVVDPPVESNATGVATFQLRPGSEEIRYRLIVANIENVTMAHIHLGERGVNGPVVVWLYPEGPPPQLIEGRSDGILAEGAFKAGDLVGPHFGDQDLQALLEEMQAGNTYVNVHTQQNPAGEIRGQIDRGNAARP